MNRKTPALDIKLRSFLWYRKFLRLSEFAGGKSRKRAKLVFLPYRKVRHNVVRCQQEFVEQILAKLAAGPTFFMV